MVNIRTLLQPMLALIFLAAAPGISNADPIVLSATNWGSLFSGCKPGNGFRCPTPDQGRKGVPETMIAGYFSGTDNVIGGPVFVTGEYRNYFVFNLSSVLDEVVSARLRVVNPLSEGAPGPYRLFDVNTPASEIVGAPVGSQNPAIFNDLGTGTILSDSGVPEALETTSFRALSMALNVDGLRALNEGRGSVLALGGAMDLSIIKYGNGIIFDGPAPFGPELVLTLVPEPTTLLLLASGLGLIAIRLFRRHSESPS